jgi:hypothetical protein
MAYWGLLLGLALLLYLWWAYYRFMLSAWKPYYEGWRKEGSKLGERNSDRFTAALYPFGDRNWNIWAPKILRYRAVRWGGLVIGLFLVIRGILVA